MTNIEIAVVCNSISIGLLAVSSIMDAVAKRRLSKRIDEIARKIRGPLERPNEPPPVRPMNEHLG